MSDRASVIDDLYHLLTWNGFPTSWEDAAEAVDDPANAGLVTAVRHAPAANKRMWRARREAGAAPPFELVPAALAGPMSPRPAHPNRTATSRAWPLAAVLPLLAVAALTLASCGARPLSTGSPRESAFGTATPAPAQPAVDDGRPTPAIASPTPPTQPPEEGAAPAPAGTTTDWMRANVVQPSAMPTEVMPPAALSATAASMQPFFDTAPVATMPLADTPQPEE